MRAMATKCLAEVEGVAAVGTNFELIHTTDEHPYHAIIDAAKKNGCDRS